MTNSTQKITIMDGGMGRLLERMGAPFRRPEWSALALMDDPKTVTQAHNDFIAAGAQIITTNAYALVPFHIGQDRFDQDGAALINLSATIARDCADQSSRDIKVAGSLPPAFGSYRPDLYEDDKANNIYRPLIDHQQDHVDFWLAETLSSTIEVRKIATKLKDRNKPLWLSYTLRDRSGEDIAPQLRSGEDIEDAVKCALAVNADALLFNCSQPEEMAPALKIVQAMNLDIPYGVYANAFEPIRRDQDASSENAHIRDDAGPEAYLSFAKQWTALGATIIGGCCGIFPEHIEALNALNTLNEK